RPITGISRSFPSSLASRDSSGAPASTSIRHRRRRPPAFCATRASSAPPPTFCHYRIVRILLFSGKGGVGKTSLAAATGVRLAQLGLRTLVMSVDPAHSLGDAFDLGGDLFHNRTSDPYSITPNLDIQEVNIQVEIRRHWQEISGYVS